MIRIVKKFVINTHALKYILVLFLLLLLMIVKFKHDENITPKILSDKNLDFSETVALNGVREDHIQSKEIM